MTHQVVDDRQAVRRFVAGHVGEDGFTDDQDLFGSGLVSSLFAVQVVMWVERTLGTALQPVDLDIANFSSINTIADFVARKRASAAG